MVKYVFCSFVTEGKVKEAMHSSEIWMSSAEAFWLTIFAQETKQLKQEAQKLFSASCDDIFVEFWV